MTLAFTAIMVNAQVNPKPGYVITLQNDTLWGSIDLRTDERNMEKCTFRLDGRQRWVTYTPDQINGYRFTNTGKYYVSRFLPIKGDRTLCFAEYMVKGKMNLYYIPLDDSYFFENEQKKIFEYKMDPSNVENDLEALKPLLLFIKDSPAATKKVSKYRMYRDNLIAIALEYNREMCKSPEDCVVFEYDKKKNKTNAHFRIFGGMAYTMRYEIAFKYADMASTYRSHVSPMLGVGVDVDLPKIAQGLSAQVKAMYSKKAYDYNYLWYGEPESCKVNDNHLMIDAGVAYCTNHQGKGIKPLLLGGLTADLASGDIEGERSFKENTGIYFGAYAGFGLLIPVGKTNITFDFSYHKSISSNNQGMIYAAVGVCL